MTKSLEFTRSYFRIYDGVISQHSSSVVLLTDECANMEEVGNMNDNMNCQMEDRVVSVK